jgi:hypothetical protein
LTSRGRLAVVNEAVAGLVGVFVGAGITEASQWFRLKAETRRLAAERLARARGSARLVSAEIGAAHRNAKHAPAESIPRLPTQAWERYGPDIASELPLEVVDSVATAYFAIENLRTTAAKWEPTTQELASLKKSTDTKHLALVAEWVGARRTALDGVVEQADKARKALGPHVT